MPGKSWEDSRADNSRSKETTNFSPKPAKTCPDPCAPLVQTNSTEMEIEPLDLLPSFTFTPSKCGPLDTRADMSTKKVQYLKQSVNKRLSSVDQGWLERCQVFSEVESTDKPVAGNLPEEKTLQTNASNRNVNIQQSALKPPVENGVAKESPPRPSQKVLLEVDFNEPPLKTRVTKDSNSSSQATKEDAKLNEVKDCFDPPVEATSKSETKRQKKTPRSKKVQEPTEASDHEQKPVKKKGRKRQREVEEGDEQAAVTEGVQKKRRTKKENPTDRSAPKKGRKKKGMPAEEANDVVSERKMPQKSCVPQENLLGEVDEEDVRATSARRNNPQKSR